MKFPRRLPHFRSLKFAPFALISLFLFSNLTGLLFSHVLAPVAVGYIVKASGWAAAFWLTAAISTAGIAVYLLFGKAEKLVD